MNFSILLVLGVFQHAYGTLGPWSEWSECSATCGDATRHRSRQCSSHGDCSEKEVRLEKEACKHLPGCGTLGEWSDWTQCTTTCGKGTRQRQRRCIGPGDCNGALIDEDFCQDQPNCIGNVYLLSTLS